MSDQAKTHTHGRGGAGNINSKPAEALTADDLQTPTIKSSTYTTGRGGSGNMATNESSENARLAQDVEAPAHHQKEPKGTFHWGRGGEGNKVTVGGPNADAEVRSRSKEGAGRRRSSVKDVVEKGKAMLGLKKDKDKGEGGSAVVNDDEK